jgi:predicted PurR-regulated permease PerM
MDDATISWTVILALGTILGLFFTVGKPIINLNSTITELITRLKRMESDLDEFKTHNHEAHKKIHERIDKVEDDINCIKQDVENIKRDVITITK